VKIAILPKLINLLKAIPIKISAQIFKENDELTRRFIQKCKKSKITKSILKKSNKVRGLTIPNFKAYYKAIEILTSQKLKTYMLQGSLAK
jgi:hypothetical protein